MVVSVGGVLHMPRAREQPHCHSPGRECSLSRTHITLTHCAHCPGWPAPISGTPPTRHRPSFPTTFLSSSPPLPFAPLLHPRSPHHQPIHRRTVFTPPTPSILSRRSPRDLLYRPKPLPNCFSSLLSPLSSLSPLLSTLRSGAATLPSRSGGAVHSRTCRVPPPRAQPL